MSRIIHLSVRLEEANGLFIVRLRVTPFLLVLTLYNWILEKFNLIWKALQTPSFPPPTHNIQRGSGRGRPLRTNQAPSRATTSRFMRRRHHCAPVHLHPTCLREIQSLRSQSPPPSDLTSSASLLREHATGLSTRSWTFRERQPGARAPESFQTVTRP